MNLHARGHIAARRGCITLRNGTLFTFLNNVHATILALKANR